MKKNAEDGKTSDELDINLRFENLREMMQRGLAEKIDCAAAFKEQNIHIPEEMGADTEDARKFRKKVMDISRCPATFTVKKHFHLLKGCVTRHGSNFFQRLWERLDFYKADLRNGVPGRS